jgi:predicted nucleic acid-binding protein
VATDVAVLDACVLYPAQLRDLLLSLADADLFRPKWSDTIHEEWINALLANRKDLTRNDLEAIRDQMNQYFLDSVVQGFENLIPALTLPDPKDCHVLAAAIHSHADLIITNNLKHFPQIALAQHNIWVADPDQFANYLLDLDEDDALAALAKMRVRLKNPPMTATEFIDSIEKAGLPGIASRLRPLTARL